MAQGSQEAMEQIRAASQQVNQMIGGLSESMAQQVAAVKELAQGAGAGERDEPEHHGGHGGAGDQREAGDHGGGERERADAGGGLGGGGDVGATEQLSGMAQQLQGLVAQFKVEARTESVALPVPSDEAEPQAVVA